MQDASITGVSRNAAPARMRFAFPDHGENPDIRVVEKFSPIQIVSENGFSLETVSKFTAHSIGILR